MHWANRKKHQHSLLAPDFLFSLKFSPVYCRQLQYSSYVVQLDGPGHTVQLHSSLRSPLSGIPVRTPPAAAVSPIQVQAQTTVLPSCLEMIFPIIPLCLSLFQRQSYIKPLSKSLEKRINLGEFSSQYGEWYRYYFEGRGPSAPLRARDTLLEVMLEHVMAFWLSGLPSVALSHQVKLWVTLKCQTVGHHCLQFHPFYMSSQLFIVRVVRLCLPPLTGTAYECGKCSPPLIGIYFKKWMRRKHFSTWCHLMPHCSVKNC